MKEIGTFSKTKKLICLLPLIIACVLWGVVWYLHQSMPKSGNGTVVTMENAGSDVAMDHPQFIKEPYEPVIPEGVNIAPDGKIDASSFQETYVPRKAIDGKVKGISYWEGAEDTYPNRLILTWKEMHSCHAIKICLCPDAAWSERIQKFSVEISRDGEVFEELIPEKEYVFSPDTGNEIVLEFPEETILGIQLVFTDNTGASGAQVAELEVYEK